MKCPVALVLVFALSGAFASEPGQPLDCSDWVFLEPGLSCRIVDECGPVVAFESCFARSGRHADNAGGLLEVRAVGISGPPCPNGGETNARVQLSRLNDGVRTVIGYLQDRCGIPNSVDQVHLFNGSEGDAGFEPNYGRLYIGIETGCIGACGPGNPSGFTPRLFVIEGFTTTFEILQSYVPTPSSVGFRVPYMPEGMAGADHFDSYWGPLTHPLDFTQAHPLHCDYPASPPHVGDYLTVADTVPTPAPGQGVYYVTAATHQGATRYGRRTTAGHMSGRDPALLPACTTKNDR